MKKEPRRTRSPFKTVSPAMDLTRARPLERKVVLITGASRGIGAAAAKRIARAGGVVVVNYHNSHEQAQAVLREVEEEGGKGMLFRADVTQRNQVEEMARAVRESFGAVDILVNNAYFPFEVNFLHEISWEGVEEAISKELAAFYNCTRAFVPAMMEKKKGKIIVISTRLAQQPLPRMGAYAAAKSALETMADTMALELGPNGIAVNVVTPAFTLTDASAMMPDEFRERVRKSRPLQKHLYPEDVAGTIAFLASDEADMMTGTHILITGGSHLQL
ncbi:MAG: SDR family oxidoreductase [Deltaproteobacteria bacterium]|nr:SDR family oxidoreductase [Deltaproteobacteria bacterium]